jgi:hypothetical protein
VGTGFGEMVCTSWLRRLVVLFAWRFTKCWDVDVASGVNDDDRTLLLGKKIEQA